MKNTIFASLAFTILLLTVIGCSSINPFADKSSQTSSNKTLTDKGVDAVVGEETTGVPECDEAMDMIASELNNPDDGYIVKAGKALVLNRIKESIKKAVEENKNKNSTADLVKTCADFKKQMVKAKEEEEKKQ